MPAPSPMLRWILMAVLALGVAAMHHVPSQHAQPQIAATAHAEHPSPAEHPEPSPTGHDLLHLCLAVAVGFLVLLAPRLRLLALAPIEARRARPQAEAVPLAPPTPRRLAELCVLRL
ncbi:hypothetical protein [Saccharopolyspora griseoalba]|uniref:Secreted protein n=1 Tax=Saccharopolyspora griseoalba TaxID=1431848 RepID=A0ABW2LFP0_9PSEU